MKKKLSVGLFLLALGVLFLSPVASAQEINSVIKANNQFAFDLYSKYRSKEGNVFYSPYSISSALAMTYEGARGTTAEEMRAVFHFPQDASIRRDSFLKINQQINKKDKKYALSTANALWAQKDYKFLDDYFSLVDQYYGGKVTNMDFVNETEQSRLTINSWVEEQTKDKIKNLIPPGLITPNIALVLTNAIYFKGFWFKQFNKKNTKKEEFRISPDNKIKTQMMRLSGKEAKFNYAETENLQILELPYEGNDLSMLILLPREDDLKVVEGSLSSEKLSEWKGFLRKEQVNIYFPKFFLTVSVIARKSTFPLPIFGSSSKTMNFFGIAIGGSFLPIFFIRSPSLTFSVTAATRRAPLSESGISTRQQPTPSGKRSSRTLSVFTKETISPPIFTKRFNLPRCQRNPSLSIKPISPVSYQPSLMRREVSSISSKYPFMTWGPLVRSFPS